MNMMSKKEQNTDKKVRIIEADPELSKKNDSNRVLKVAAYCRVSTDDEDQLNSYYTQKAYYTEYIKRNPNGALPESMQTKVLPAPRLKSEMNFFV